MLSDFNVRDTVRTPTGRCAIVFGLKGARIVLHYIDDGEEVELPPHILSIVSRAPHRVMRPGFLAGVGAIMEGRAI